MTEEKMAGFKELMRAKSERDAKLEALKLQESTKDGSVESTKGEIPHSTGIKLVDSSVDSTSRQKEVVVESTTPPKENSGLHQKKVVESRKLDRHNKNKTRIQPRIDKAILRKIKGFCDKNAMELGEYIEMLALHHLDLVESTNRGGRSPQIDKMIHYRSSSLLINLYETLTKKNRWTWNDDKEGSRFSEAEIEAIEIAMIRTIIRAKNPIRTFKYFVPEIELEIEMQVSPELRTIQLASARKVFDSFRQGIPTDSYS